MEIIFCEFCGKKIPDESHFCQYCGKAVEPMGQAQSMQGQNPYGQPAQSQPVGNGYYQQGQPAGNGYYQQGQPAGNGYYQQGQPAGNGYYQQEYGYGQQAYAGAGYGAPATAAPRRNMAMWIVGAAGVVIAAVALIMVYTFFIKSETPEDTVARMEEALNDLDTEALLECFDEQTQDLYSGALGVGSDISGLDLEAWAELGNGLGGLISGTDLAPEFSLTVLDVEYLGTDSCIVTVEMGISYMGSTDSSTEELPMVKEGRKWLVSISDASSL